MVSREMRDMTPMDFTNRFGEFPTREGLTILVVSLLMCVIYFILVYINVTYSCVHFLYLIVNIHKTQPITL